MAVNDFDQWSTARPLISAFPQWVGESNAARIASYLLYETIYWNVPEAFKVVQRGEDAKPIYVPSGKQIVETMHRYVAPRLNIIPDPLFGSTAEQQEALNIMLAFVRRERFYSRFSTNKRYGLIRGDWLWHIFADEERPEGARISIFPLDPGSYFPIHDEEDIDTIIGCHIVDQITDGGKARIQRLTYRKMTETGGPSPISVEEAIYESDAWGGPDMEEKTVKILRPPTELPAPIDQLPVYHIQNFQETGSVWGSSEMRGLERLMTAINQGISDEELELVMNGLGVYATDAGTPVNPDTNEPADWNLGPAKVIELQTGKKFERVSGVTSLVPYQEHLKYLHDQLDLGAGTPSIAKGIVDVKVADSGIALALHLAPILSKGEEKDQVVTDVTTNMLFDLRNWFIAYEGINVGEAIWLPTYADKVPPNRKQKFDEIMKMVEANIVSWQWARKELTKIGFEFGDDTTMMSQVLEEQQMLAQIKADVTGSRIDSELDGGEEEEETDDDAGL